MHADRLRKPLERLRQTLAPADGAGLSDGQLLARFVASRDEVAFAALVRRHGPMVLGVVRRLVRHEQDAEDCFQAAFLVLAQRAGSVRKRESLASWLYGVAYRVALDAGGAAARRRSRERQVEQMPHPEVSPTEPQDWRPLLDQELMALPEKYRSAVVLCDLEGRPRKEAARLLRLSEGTLSSRLARARSLLAGRLSRRGVALSGAALAAALAGGAATAAVPAQMAVSTAKVAALVAAGNAAAVGSQAALFLHEFQRGMLMAKLKVGAALAAVAVLLGAGGLAYRVAGQAPTSPPVKRAEVRAPADVELLRKEVELLKLQVELLQEKVRVQGLELRDLKGRAGRGAPRFGQTAPPDPRFRPAGSTDPSAAPKSGTVAPASPATSAQTPVPNGTTGALPAHTPGSLAPTPSNQPLNPGNGRDTTPDAIRQAEAALKALREARDPEARRRAAEALERAARKLRGQPGDSERPSSTPQGN
jgi:RNA polymerase sigma factor (sigma-70 family)